MNENRQVTLEEILFAREKRVQRQRNMLMRNGYSLISFMLNIPGPVKTGEAYAWLFNRGVSEIFSLIRKSHWQVLEYHVEGPVTGYEALFSVAADAVQIKKLLLPMEEMTREGRLYDIDVLDTDGKKISREALGFPARRCLLCENPAHVCSRSRSHSVEEMTASIAQIIANCQKKEKIRVLLEEAMLEEVYTTPKPGLVDLQDNGAHKDMDCTTFEKSTAAISPFLAEMYVQGLTHSGSRKELFLSIRQLGVQAEKAMLQATAGVNTHKGMIFTLGLFSAAAGVCKKELACYNAAYMQKIIAEMTEDILLQEIKALKTSEKDTYSAKACRQYDIHGVRGLAVEGYEIVTQKALAMMNSMKEKEVADNDIRIRILLYLISHVADTNVLGRSSMDMLLKLQKEAEMIGQTPLKESETLRCRTAELNDWCIAAYISPGGCADLLAATLFLHKLQQIPVH